MLRITVHHEPGVLTFQLEGKLTGPWVREAEEAWQRTLASPHAAVLRVDLTSVTMIDAAGRALLTAAHAQGAEFVARGCFMTAIVGEVTRSASPFAPRKDDAGGNPKPDDCYRRFTAFTGPPFRGAKGEIRG